jgi:Uma2 family endonuclease
MSTLLHLTADEYGQMVQRGAFDHLDRKIELIRGELREMNPSGPVHDDLVVYLTNWSFRAISSDSILVASQTGVNLADLESRPEPDVLWLRKARYHDRHPSAGDVRLAIEVSDSSLQSDLIEKATLYAEAGIVEYWIVDVQSKCVHVFRSPQEGEYTDRSIAKTGETLSPLEPSQSPLDIADLFSA